MEFHRINSWHKHWIPIIFLLFLHTSATLALILLFGGLHNYSKITLYVWVGISYWMQLHRPIYSLPRKMSTYVSSVQLVGNPSANKAKYDCIMTTTIMKCKNMNTRLCAVFLVSPLSNWAVRFSVNSINYRLLSSTSNRDSA